MQPRVVDLSHHNIVLDLHAAAEAGLWGVIHKATQGKAYVDPKYTPRRKDIVNAGLLHGAYHFNTGDAVPMQVQNFLRNAAPIDDTLMVLDYEDNRLSQMSIQQVLEFLHLMERALQRQIAIYSGNKLKETIGRLGPLDREYLCSHRLWLAQYGPKAKLPDGFKNWWLWQYTGDGVGPKPHSIKGISGTGLDLNAYAGSKEQLTKEWAGLAAPDGLGLV